MKRITIGRSSDNNLVINNNMVSRYHCEIIQDANGIKIVDLNSSNGTFVNGKRVYGATFLNYSDNVCVHNIPIRWQNYFVNSQTFNPSKKTSNVLPIILGVLGRVLVLIAIVYLFLRYGISQEMDEAITEEVDGESNPLYDQRYSPQTIYVAAGQDFRDALYASQPEIRSHEELNNVGGAKLIAEMSADKAGISTSAYNTDYLLSIRPLHELKLTIDDDPVVIYNRIYSGDIALNSCDIGGNLFGLQVKFSLRNQTNEEIEVVIPLGQMIESTRNDVQNIVISQEKTITLKPYESIRLSIPALCGAKMRGGPSGSAARVTPYVMNAPYHVFSNQESVWNFQKEPNIFPVVFYAWGRGTPVGNGNVSTAGHAFAHIPRVGYIGFGSANGDKFGDEGRVFDHRYQHRFATDSCTLLLTKSQLENVYQTIDDLMDSPPNYYIGYYDCTSFVMDIADAAGVYYGNRIFIQTPMGFIRQMKQYNEIR